MRYLSRWAWTAVGDGMIESGSVHAVNARDAFGRLLTCEIEAGVCRGEALGLSPQILLTVPDDVDGIHECTIRGIYFHVRMLSAVGGDTYDMSPMHQAAMATAFEDKGLGSYVLPGVVANQGLAGSGPPKLRRRRQLVARL